MANGKAGTVRSGDVVSLGKPLAITGDVDGTVVSIGGDVTVTGAISGDVVVLGGNAVVSGPGTIGRDLLVIGGEARTEGAGVVRGSLRTISATEAAFLTELKTSPLSGRRVSLLLTAFRLILLTFWLGSGLLLLRLRPRRVQAAAASATDGLATAAALGVSAILSGVLLTTFALATLPPAPGFVLVFAAVLILVAAKVFGLAALFVAVGRALTRRAKRGSPLFGDPAALAVGLAPFGLVSLVPGVGPVVWGVVSLLGIGLAIRTAFGAQGSALSVANV